jgi:hypothetical protein
MRRVLRDDSLETEFQREGFVRVPFLDSRQVESLKQAFFDLQQISGGNMTNDDAGIDEESMITYDFTFIDKNIEYKRAVFDKITSEFHQRASELLADYKPIIANFIRKKTEGGEVPLHQNWAFVDERRCTSISIWVPLVDSTVENGTLQVVPKSHKRFGEIRGPMIPWELDNIKKEIIENDLIPLETKAGDGVILDDSIVHYSAINKTDGLRLTIQLIMIPAEEPSIHYHLDPHNDAGKVKVLEVDKDFYMEFNPWKKPEGVKVQREFEFTPPFAGRGDYLDRLGAHRIDEERKKAGLWDRIKSIVS